MTDKSAVYLNIAKRSAAQGDNVRAIVTILNALGNNPHYMETQPESTDFFIGLSEPAANAAKQVAALIAAGSTDTIELLEDD